MSVSIWKEQLNVRCGTLERCPIQLAYFQGDPATVNQTISCFDAGDLVQFEVYHEAKLRKALNPKVVRSKADADLPNKLLRHSAGITRKQTGGEVLPFRPKAAPPVEFRHRGQA